MSYCRISPDCDVYVFAHERIICNVRADRLPSQSFATPGQAAISLREMKASGIIKVPECP